MDWLALSGRPALVVGAGGLGGASAVSLAAQGARVVVVDIDEGKLEPVSRSAKEAGTAVETIAADLRDAGRCRQAVDDAVGRVGVPQVFLHAVGRNIKGTMAPTWPASSARPTTRWPTSASQACARCATSASSS